MYIEYLTMNGFNYQNVPAENLSELGLSDAEINQIINDEEVKIAKEAVTSKRDTLLIQTDYLVMPDYPLVDKTAVEIYRQALRDITLQEGYPLNIDWPELT